MHLHGVSFIISRRKSAWACCFLLSAAAGMSQSHRAHKSLLILSLCSAELTNIHTVQSDHHEHAESLCIWAVFCSKCTEVYSSALTLWAASSVLVKIVLKDCGNYCFTEEAGFGGFSFTEMIGVVF